MRMLNRSEPMTTTFGPDAATTPYYQDGLYFNTKGELMNTPHNVEVYKMRGLNIDDDLSTPATPPAGAPAPDDALAGKSSAEVFGIAEKLRAQLDIAEDGDNYVPTAGAFAQNVEFIRRHAE